MNKLFLFLIYPFSAPWIIIFQNKRLQIFIPNVRFQQLLGDRCHCEPKDVQILFRITPPQFWIAEADAVASEMKSFFVSKAVCDVSLGHPYMKLLTVTSREFWELRHWELYQAGSKSLFLQHDVSVTCVASHLLKG